MFDVKRLKQFYIKIEVKLLFFSLFPTLHVQDCHNSTYFCYPHFKLAFLYL